MGVAYLAINGNYESLKRLVDKKLTVLKQWAPLHVFHILLVYLMASGGERLSQINYFAWDQVRGLIGCVGLSATSLRNWMIAVAEHAKEKVPFEPCPILPALPAYADEIAHEFRAYRLPDGGYSR